MTLFRKWEETFWLSSGVSRARSLFNRVTRSAVSSSPSPSDFFSCQSRLKVSPMEVVSVAIRAVISRTHRPLSSIRARSLWLMVSVRMFSNSSRSRSSRMLPVESMSVWRDCIKS